MKKPFIPRDIAGRRAWLNNFTAKLPLYAAKYNVAGAEMNNLMTAVAYFRWIDDFITVAAPNMDKALRFRHQLLDGIPEGGESAQQPVATLLPPPPARDSSVVDIIGLASAIAQGIKTRTNYNPADGTDLGIEGEERAQRAAAEMQPVLKLRIANGGQVDIGWTKGQMDALKIYADRGEGAFSLLAIDTVPGYLDTHALPPAGQSAVWKYRAIYMKDDAEAGQPSEVVSITVSGGIV